MRVVQHYTLTSAAVAVAAAASAAANSHSTCVWISLVFPSCVCESNVDVKIVLSPRLAPRGQGHHHAVPVGNILVHPGGGSRAGMHRPAALRT